MANTAQRSFSSGELAPSLYARTDQAKYATGLRTCRNFIVLRGGGVANRPGTELVGEVKSSDASVRLMKFVFNAEQSYVIEAGPNYFRWIVDGGYLVVSPDAWADATSYAVGDIVSNGGVNYYCTVAHTSEAEVNEPGVDSWQGLWYAMEGEILEIPTPYAEDELMEIQSVQSADVLTLVHANHPPHELKRFAHDRWTLTPAVFGPTIASPTNVNIAGGDAGDKTYWAITAIDETTLEESLPTFVDDDLIPSDENPITITWDPVPNAIEYNIYRSFDGLTYGYVGTAGGTQQETEDNTWDTSSAEVETQLKDQWVVAGEAASNEVVSTAAGKPADGRFKVTAQLSIEAIPDGPLDNPVTQGTARIYYSRDSETPIEAGPMQGHVLQGPGIASWGVNRTITVPDNGYSELVITLVPEVLGTSDAGTTFKVNILGGPISFVGGAFSFTDTGIDPDFTIGPPTHPNVFSTEGDYPSVVGLVQQRRWFGATRNAIEKVWGSRIAQYLNYGRSTPIQDDDAVIFSMAGRQVNAVRHLIDLGGMVIFTSGGEWTIEGDEAGIITPSSINPRQRAYNGAASRLSPLLANRTALYVQARGTIVRDLFGDSVQGYHGNDLTIFSTHLFDGYTLKDWDYAQIPNSIVWAVRSDGTLLGLTYMREHEIWGWHRHDTLGSIERVCVVPEGEEDRLYLVIRREINGVTRRYVERMSSRFFTDIVEANFLDSSITYDGRHTGNVTMTLSGDGWTNEDLLTLTASEAVFVSTDVDDAIYLYDSEGELIRFRIMEVVNGTTVQGLPNRTVPATLQGVADRWGFARRTFAGLEHLEGQAVGVYADAFVAASPNNDSYGQVVVEDGKVTLDQPYLRVRIGLPYLSDFETLDIDRSSGSSLKDRGMNVGRVGLFVEASRGIFAGRSAPVGDDPLGNLAEARMREHEPYDEPIRLKTGFIDINIESGWDSHGRVFVRQVDPIPLTILSVVPQGHLPFRS